LLDPLVRSRGEGRDVPTVGDLDEQVLQDSRRLDVGPLGRGRGQLRVESRAGDEVRQLRGRGRGVLRQRRERRYETVGGQDRLVLLTQQDLESALRLLR